MVTTECGRDDSAGAETNARKVTVMVNGEERAVAQGLSVAGLLAELGVEPRVVVVEHNRRILARDRLDATPVGERDVLEVVHFVGGG